MYAYCGKILNVDLTSGEISTSDVDEKDFFLFMGGAGLAAKMYLEDWPGDVDPLDPGNPLYFMTGPWTGSRIPGGNRFEICARSPQTMLWGEASVGGYFGPELKAAGYDGIVITGASEKPVYLWIKDDQVEIRDASDLWGLDSYEAYDRIFEAGKDETGKKPKICSIGQAGENLVSFAAVAHDKGHFAGRTGMGAVMGSKKLKAVACVGTQKRPEPADPATVKEWLKPVMENMRTSVVVESVRQFGTMANFEIGTWLGDVPFKNWQLGETDEVGGGLAGPIYKDQILVKNHACWGCAIGCKRVVKVDQEGPFQLDECAGPEYETVCMFGSNVMSDNIFATAKANDMCNRLGLDTISMGQIIAFVTECQDRGLLTPEECDGLKMEWGDAETMLKLIDLCATGKGFGKRMAGGSKRLAQEIGGDAMDYTIQVRNLDFPAHDPRGCHGFGVSYTTSPRGACHCASSNLYAEQGAGKPLPKFNLGGPYDEMVSEGKGEMTAYAQDIGQILNNAVICHLTFIAWKDDQIMEAINAVTGFDYSIPDFLKTGERAWYLKRAIFQLYGSAGKDDVLPKRMLVPLDHGPTEGSVPDIDLMTKDFYETRQLDAEGRLTRPKLDELELGWVADMIEADTGEWTGLYFEQFPPQE